MISLQQETGVSPSPVSDLASPMMEMILRPGAWSEETLFAEGDAFFRALWSAIDEAQDSIDLETYIFDDDEIGRKTLEHLSGAAQRGVRVRILVDGVGSPSWNSWVQSQCPTDLINARVYKPIPYPFSNMRMFARPTFKNIRAFFSKVNRRNHRKVCLIDQKILLLGSFNISRVHSEELLGSRAWRDTGVRLQGDGVEEVRHAFNWAWRRARRAWIPKVRIKVSRLILRSYVYTDLVRLNHLARLRRHNFEQLLLKLSSARERIWIANPYFVPNRKFLKALRGAAKRGVDVKVLVPRETDVKLVRYASMALYDELILKGVAIYEYLPSFFHGKILIVDRWMTVGSSNLNHRSILHDLEVDACITLQESQHTLVRQYLYDLKMSEQVPRDARRRFWLRVLSRLALLFKYWI